MITLVQTTDSLIIIAMQHAFDYWKHHKEEIDHFSFKDWCINRWGFSWYGNYNQGTFKTTIVDHQKYTEFLLIWQ